MENLIFESAGIVNNETPENIFARYQEKREVTDYQKLWNMGIRLHYSNGTALLPCDFWHPKQENKMVAAYDKINNEMVFTKIWVY